MSLQLIVVTPQGEAYNGSVDQVVLPGTEGRFGVLADHERFLAPLRGGAMAVHEPGGVRWLAISDGFADVAADQAVVLVDRCLSREQIDPEQARADHERLAHELDRLGLDEEDQAQRPALESAYFRAEGQVEVLNQTGG